MGIFTRLGDIINANLLNMLDKAENPEKMLRLMIQEMEDTLVEVKSSAAKLIADKKGLERKTGGLRNDIALWERRAELAVKGDRDDLAITALEHKTKKLQELNLIDEQILSSDEALGHFRADIAKLEAKLNDAKAKQKSLLLRRTTLDSQYEIRSRLHQAETQSAFAKFEQLERQLDRMEGEVEMMGASPKIPLAEEFHKLENQERIAAELEALKSRAKKESS